MIVQPEVRDLRNPQTMTIRFRRMYHDREGAQNWMSCLKHGKIQPVSQDQAEYLHAKGERCPMCIKEVTGAATW